MQDLLVALYDDHSSAVQVRTALVKDGFPTDRVELTSRLEHRQADMSPGDTFATNVRHYFSTLVVEDDGGHRLDEFIRAVIAGACALTVHPRGEEEIERAERILQSRGPRDVYRYVPEDRGHAVDRKIERAAMPRER